MPGGRAEAVRKPFLLQPVRHAEDGVL